MKKCRELAERIVRSNRIPKKCEHIKRGEKIAAEILRRLCRFGERKEYFREDRAIAYGCMLSDGRLEGSRHRARSLGGFQGQSGENGSPQTESDYAGLKSRL